MRLVNLALRERRDAAGDGIRHLREAAFGERHVERPRQETEDGAADRRGAGAEGEGVADRLDVYRLLEDGFGVHGVRVSRGSDGPNAARDTFALPDQ